MKALVFSRKPAKFAAAMVAGSARARAAAPRSGPLSLRDVDPPELPGARLGAGAPPPVGHLRLRPGHHRRHVVALLRADRVVPVHPRPRGRRRPRRRPPGRRRARAQLRRPGHRPAVRRRARTAASTTASASASATSSPACSAGSARAPAAAGRPLMVAHASQLVAVPADLSDEAAVLVEPTACAVHAAAPGRRRPGRASSARHARPAHHRRPAATSRPAAELLATAKHPAPARAGHGARRRRRRRPRRARAGPSARRPARCARQRPAPRRRRRRRRLRRLARTRSPRPCASRPPAAPIHAVGMPGVTTVDLTPLWQREVAPAGLPTPTSAPTSTPPSSSCRRLDLGRLVTRHLPPAPLRGRHRPRRRRPAPAAPSRSPSTSGRNERGDISLMPRPGFVLEVDRSTPPILFHHGEGFRLEKLPAGRSRVLYPGEPLDAARGPRRRHPPRPRQPARRQPAAARAAAARA